MATTAESLPALPQSNDKFFATGWSPDGGQLAGTEWASRDGLYVYSIADRRYEQIAEGSAAIRNVDPAVNNGVSRTVKWVDDHRILGFGTDGHIRLYDLQKKTNRIVADGDTGSLSHDSRTLLVSGRSLEMDVWRMTLE